MRRSIERKCNVREGKKATELMHAIWSTKWEIGEQQNKAKKNALFIASLPCSAYLFRKLRRKQPNG